MTDGTTYGPLAGDTERDAVARALTLAFGGPESAVRAWMEGAGTQHLRNLRDERGRFLATLMDFPMGQHFGGRAVPMAGIAGVAVPPEQRGRGSALRLMQEQIRDAARNGVPISCLYASTQSLYRQVGYEQAGLFFRTTIPLRTIGIRDRSMTVRELGADDEPSIRACYEAFAPRFNGTLARGPYIWSRIHRSRDQLFTGLGVVSPDDSGALEGYLFMSQQRKPETGRHDVALSDLVFTTPRAARRLLGLLADFATVGDDAVFHGAPLHPICTLMPQQFHASKLVDAWMLRINLVKQALEARGYPAGNATLAIEITDDLVESNRGRWTVTISDRRATVEPGGNAPSIRCDIRALAPIYSGFYSASQAATLGLIEGDSEAIAAADAIFAGPAPWMPDHF